MALRECLPWCPGSAYPGAQGALPTALRELPDSALASYPMVLQQATRRRSPNRQRALTRWADGTCAMGSAQCFSGAYCHITFEYVMFVVSVQTGALGAQRPGRPSVGWEPGCTYTQGKGYLMFTNAPRTCWVLTSGYEVRVLLLHVG